MVGICTHSAACLGQEGKVRRVVLPATDRNTTPPAVSAGPALKISLCRNMISFRHEPASAEAEEGFMEGHSTYQPKGASRSGSKAGCRSSASSTTRSWSIRRRAT
jgi:hypothetical protein